MKRSVAMVMGSLAAVWAGVAVAAPSCQLVKVGELPVKFDRNRPLVPVSINGKPGWFLVDTGADDSMIFGAAAAGFGLSRFTAENVTFFGVGGSQAATYAVIKDFALSDVHVKDVRFFVIGHDGSAAEAGVLGRDFLGHFSLEFDLANKALRLWRPQHCASQSLAYWTPTPGGTDLHQDDQVGAYKVKVSINGKTIDAILDSGATTSIVTPDAAAAAGLHSADYTDERRHSRGIGETLVDTRTAIFDRVEIGTEEIRHARLEVGDMFADDTEMETGSMLRHKVEGLDNPSMLLGADFLRSHRVLIAPEQHLLYFTYNGGQIFQVVGDAVAPQGPAPSTATSPPQAPGN